MRQDKHQKRPHDDEETTEPAASGQQRRDKLDDDTEATLDEIDDVLEENVDQFVRSYVQKGGQ